CARMRGLGGARRVVVADRHVLRPHTQLFGRDLRQHGEDALADLGHARDDLGGAAVVELGPRAGAIDRRGAGDPVPARRQSASAPARHDATSLFAAGAAKRVPSVHGGRTPSLAKSARAAPRATGAPACQPDASSAALRAASRLTERSFCLVCVSAPSRIALTRRSSNGSIPSRSAQTSRWLSVANWLCSAPNDRNAPDGVLLVYTP